MRLTFILPLSPLAAGGLLLCVDTSALPAPPQAPSAMVIVARAVSACFSDTIRVTGFLVPREEALVTLDTEGYQIAEILAAEGDRVTSGQQLVRLTRQSGNTPAEPPAAGRAPPPSAQTAPATMTLRAPAA